MMLLMSIVLSEVYHYDPTKTPRPISKVTIRYTMFIENNLRNS